MIGLAIALVAACKDDPVAIAVLTETSVGTEKQTGTGPWAVAAVGTKFFRGDAVQTADGTALLSLGPTAALRVQPRSLIRFGEEQGKNSIAVELGEATLEGSGGTYQLGLGTVTLEGKSAVKITSGEGGSRLELMLGAATLESNGDTTAMAAGESYQLGMGTLTIERPDARPVADAAPPDAVPDAAIVDAAPLPPSASVSLEITGKKATYLPEGAKDWIGMPAGSAELTGGSKLKLGPKTTAKARHPGVTLELPSGARLSAGGDPFVKVDAGAARAIGEDGADGKVGMPGGFLILDGDRSGASIEVKRRETEIEVTKGTIELHGKQGKTVLQQGETALLRPDGGVKIMNEVPKHFDLRVTAGDSFTVHDPKPRPGTAVRFTFDCGGRGVVELGKGGFNAPRVSAGTDGANLMIPPKTSWRYRVRCDNGRTIANGKVLVRSDDGRRQLPKGEPPTNSVEADGFNFKIHYQNLKPKVLFRWKKATGSGLTLHVTKGADDKSFPASGNSVIVQGSDLEDGIHNFYFTNSAGAKSPVSSLDMQYDNATPSAYIEEPKDGVVWPGQIPIKGATLPGWTASVEGTAMPVDRQGRFETSISPPAANAIAIRLSHSRHGVHYYLRRQ